MAAIVLRRENQGLNSLCKECIYKSSGDTKRTKNIEGFAKKIYASYIDGAKARNIQFNLSFDDVINLIFQNCYYCGNSPSLYENKRDLKSLNIPRVGIDRKDNNIGYELNNCIPCCKSCNRMKLNLRHDEFLQQIKKIHEYQNRTI